ncbi:hypothetical protein [Breoghania sp.]|uniref:hypothetical protein n=1 Tax=Breoghania sp. TaxID=2065378 RepID=UPI0026325435|nr:hypothetical protein [Breoghania sp.]MDJ0933068.1 hypothetical protein [Breoghania sp.]
MLSGINADTPRLQLARLQSALALGRINSALPALQAKWDQGEQTPKIALNLIKTHEIARDLRQARASAEAALLALPNTAPIIVQLLSLCIDMNNDDAFVEIWKDLPKDLQARPALQGALVKKALKDEDFEKAINIHLTAAKHLRVPAREINEVLSVIRLAHFDDDLARPALKQLDALLKRNTSIIPPLTTSILRSKILFVTGNWQDLYPLVLTLENAQPRDLSFTFMRARAAFELARSEETYTSVDRVLVQDPLNNGAARLRNALLLLRGEVDRYFEADIGRAANPCSLTKGSYIELTKNLSRAGRHKQAANLLKHPPKHLKNNSRIAFQRQLLTGQQAKTDQASTCPPPESTPPPLKREKLERMFDFETETSIICSPLSRWRGNCNAREQGPSRNGDTPPIARRIVKIIGDFPRFSAPPKILVDTDFGDLGQRMQDRLPTPIVTSHSGPPMLSLLMERFETVRYLVQPFQKKWIGSLEGHSIRYQGQNNDTAVEIIHALRYAERTVRRRNERHEILTRWLTQTPRILRRFSSLNCK